MKVLRIFKSWIINIWCYIFKRGIGFKPTVILVCHRDPNSAGIEPTVVSFDKDGFTLRFSKLNVPLEYFYWL